MNLELHTWDHDQMAFEDLQEGRLHCVSGQPVSVLRHPPSKNGFPNYATELVFQLVPIALVLSQGTAG